jgi:menaquinone-dependent protoporphyrinogen IX oxidase
MKGAVIYHSKHGNCEQIARSIHKGLVESGADATITDVKTAAASLSGLDFVVVGSPTRAGRATGAVRRFLKNLDVGDGSARFAAFGTGLAKWLPKGEPIAAEDIHKALEEKGLRPLAEPLRAGVSGWKGPLIDGEVERAYEYGKNLVPGAGVPAGN